MQKNKHSGARMVRALPENLVFFGLSEAKAIAHCGRALLESAIAAGTLRAADSGAGHRGKSKRFLIAADDLREWVLAGRPTEVKS